MGLAGWGKCLTISYSQWSKWSCESGGGVLTWWSQVGAKPIPIPHPTNLALFGHKVTLYRFNRGAHTIAGGSIRSRGLNPLTLTTAYSRFDTIHKCNTWTDRQTDKYRPTAITALNIASCGKNCLELESIRLDAVHRIISLCRSLYSPENMRNRLASMSVAVAVTRRQCRRQIDDSVSEAGT